MSEQIKPPHRAVRLVLDLEADTREDLLSALRQIGIEIAMGQLTKGVSGGYSSGYSYEYTESASPTHDQYFEALNLYLKQNKG
jgi:hypothetical protein